MKKYFIRSVAFLYNDEYLFPAEGFGNLETTYDNLEEATRALKKLNWRAMCGISPDQYQPISYCYRGNNEESKNLNVYLKNTFGRPLLVPSDYSEGQMVDTGYSFPGDLTVEQAWEIHKISGITHFELVEVNGEQSGFWGVKMGYWTKDPGSWASGHALNFNKETQEFKQEKIPLYFNSEEAAQKHCGNIIYRILEMIKDGGIQGSLTELSDAPEILKSFIENNDSANYEEATQTLHLKFMPADQFNILNGLLKEKIVEAAVFPMSEIEKLGKGWEPEM